MSAQAIICATRVRPFNAREMRFKSVCVIEMSGNTTSISTGKKTSIGEKPRDFAFDHAFWTHSKDDVRDDRPFADQALVYEKMGAPLLENILSGRNSCLFAYGQTGSGKSYSMLGAPSDPGILPRLCQNLFAAVNERKANGVSVRVECSFCEIYNEVCQDLLAAGGPTSGGLKVRQDPVQGIFVQGLTKASTTTFEQFDALMTRALDNRAVSSTNMNAVSSRSHAIIMLNVVQVEAGTSCTRTAKLSMVDLAGSERAESTGATGDTMKEAQNINSSLSTLGMCLARLADIADGKKGLHVPFRDSQLTWLLSDNLGGNSRTSMIAAISPADVNYEETLSTLRFASITKRVKTVAVVNESANDKLIRELREELAGLQGQLEGLKKGGVASEQLLRAVGAGAGGGGGTGDDGDIDGPSQQPSLSAAELLGTPDKSATGAASAASASAASGQQDAVAAAAALRKKQEELRPPADWKAPQFVNLSPDPSAAGKGNPIGIFEGGTTMRIGKNCVIVVHYSGLTGQVTLRVLIGDVFLNGVALEAEDSEDALQIDGAGPAVALKQNDRVIIFQDVTKQSEVDVLRFTHYQAVLEGEGKAFRQDPIADARHCELLESYSRTLIAKEALDEFMIMCSVNMEMPPAHARLYKAIGEALVLAEIDEQMLHSEQFAKETALTEEYPQLEQTDDYKVEFDATEFQAAMSMQQGEVEEKAAQLQSLRDKMAKQAADHETADLQNITLAKATADAAEKRARQILESAESEIARMSDAARGEENALQERLDEGAAERVYAVELAYHKEVRNLQKFRSAPADPEDLALFKRFSVIIQNDAMLNCVRMAENVELCDPLVSQLDFALRTICVSQRFLFVYQQLYRREPLLFAIYLPGARSSLTSDPVSKKHVVDLTGACARSPAPEHQRDPPQIRIRFTDEREARAWRSWFDHCALPPPPMSIWKVKLESELSNKQQQEQQSSSSHQAQVESDPGKPFEMKGWAPDDSTTKCTRCQLDFGFFRRKHHCRECGEIFCSACLDSKKVCVECQKLANAAAAAATSSSPSPNSATTPVRGTGAGGNHADPAPSPAQSPTSTGGGAAANKISDGHKAFRPRHRLIMKETAAHFPDSGKNFACYLRARIVGHPTRRRLDDFAVSLSAQEAEEGTLGLPPDAGTPQAKQFRPYLLDLFRGRFHEWCGVDISHVWRCSFHPLAVHLRLTLNNSDAEGAAASTAAAADVVEQQNVSASPGAKDAVVFSTEAVEDRRPKIFMSIFCTSVADRERLFEGIALMIGRRGFSPIRSGQGSNELDLLVTSAEAAASAAESSNSNSNSSSIPRTCAIRLTNQLRTQLRVRVSRQVQGAKFHFQQGDFDLIAATCMNQCPPWTAQYLRSAGMVQLSDPIPLSPGTSLFVAASESLAQHTTPPVSANARGICAVMLGIHESNLLLVASTADDIATFEDVTDAEQSELFKDEVEEAEKSEGEKLSRKSSSMKENSAKSRADSLQPQIGSPHPNGVGLPVPATSDDVAAVWGTPENPPPPNDQRSLLIASSLPLDRLLMWPLKDVDPVEQFENVVVIGHHVQMSNFTTKEKCGIQFRSSDGQVLMESGGHIEASIMVPHIILKAFRMTGHAEDKVGATELPAHINVKVAQLRDPQGVPIARIPDSNINVVANLPFEHCTEALSNMSFGGGGGGKKDAQADGSKKRVGNTIRLLDTVAEYSTSKNLFVVIKDFGTATVPFHYFLMHQKRRTCIVTAPVMYCGIETGKVDLSISLS